MRDKTRDAIKSAITTLQLINKAFDTFELVLVDMPGGEAGETTMNAQWICTYCKARGNMLFPGNADGKHKVIKHDHLCIAALALMQSQELAMALNDIP